MGKRDIVIGREEEGKEDGEVSNLFTYIFMFLLEITPDSVRHRCAKTISAFSRQLAPNP